MGKKSFSCIALVIVLGGMRPAQAVTFGTLVDGSPITWTENLAGGSVAVNGNGYLQFTAPTVATGPTGATMEIDYGGAGLFAGSNSGMKIVWEDSNTGGAVLPKMDVFLTDIRSGFLNNRVFGESAFVYGDYAGLRYDPNATEQYVGDPTVPRAPAGTSVVHSLVVQKISDGSMNFTFDNLPTLNSSFLSVNAGLGTDNSKWGFAVLRIRGAESVGGTPDVFTIRSLSFFVPEPSSFVLVGLGAVGLFAVARRRCRKA